MFCKENGEHWRTKRYTSKHSVYGYRFRNKDNQPHCKALAYNTGFKLIEKINATAPQPQRNILKYFAIFKNVAHSLEPGS